MDGYDGRGRPRHAWHGRRPRRRPAARLVVVLAIVGPAGILTAVAASVMAVAGVGQGWRQGFTIVMVTLTLLAVASTRRRGT